jgi:hypothetical protein
MSPFEGSVQCHEVIGIQNPWSATGKRSIPFGNFDPAQLQGGAFPLTVQLTISQKSRASAPGAVTFGLWLAAISK